MKTKLTKEDKEWIHNNYQQGVPTLQIQRKMHISWLHLQKVLAEFGMITRLRKRSPTFRELEHRANNGVKKCTRCQEKLPVESFYPRPQGGDGYQSICRKCHGEQSRLQRIKRLYGLSGEEYQNKFLSQTRCAICNRPEIVITHGKVHPLIVDHDHKTGKVREAICHRCNLALGAIDDNLFIAEQLASYIFQWRQQHGKV